MHRLLPKFSSSRLNPGIYHQRDSDWTEQVPCFTGQGVGSSCPCLFFHDTPSGRWYASKPSLAANSLRLRSYRAGKHKRILTLPSTGTVLVAQYLAHDGARNTDCWLGKIRPFRRYGRWETGPIPEIWTPVTLTSRLVIQTFHMAFDGDAPAYRVWTEKKKRKEKVPPPPPPPPFWVNSDLDLQDSAPTLYRDASAHVYAAAHQVFGCKTKGKRAREMAS